MSDDTADIRFEPVEDAWELQRTGTDESILNRFRMSATDALGLAESASMIQKCVASQLPGSAGNYRPTYTSPIVEFGVQRDFAGHILRQVALTNGLIQTYSLPPEGAQRLAATILAEIAKTDAPASGTKPN